MNDKTSMNYIAIDKARLARYMLKWEEKLIELQEIENLIINSVLLLKQTVDTGNVRATYSGGRKTYQYQDAVNVELMSLGENSNALIDVIEDNSTTETVTKTNWKAVCDDFGIDDIPFKQSQPSVKLKLMT